MSENKRITFQDIIIVKMMENGGSISSMDLKKQLPLTRRQLTTAKESLVRRGLVSCEIIKRKAFQPYVGWIIRVNHGERVKRRIKKILEKVKI